MLHAWQQAAFHLSAKVPGFEFVRFLRLRFLLATAQRWHLEREEALHCTRQYRR